VLLSTATLLGSEVRNPQGEDIGDLDHLLIDPHTGRIMYAVITVGAILGIGGERVQVPWETLKVARDGETFILHTVQPLVPQASSAKDKSPPAPAEPSR
jgi:sporulation protein YlmC with PRC-barrel domain